MSPLSLSLFSAELTTISKNTLLNCFTIYISTLLYNLKTARQKQIQQKNKKSNRNQIPKKSLISPLATVADAPGSSVTLTTTLGKTTDQSATVIREACQVFSSIKVYMNFSNRLNTAYGIKRKPQFPSSILQ